MIRCMQLPCVCDGRHMSLEDAIPLYTLMVCKAMTDGRERIPEVWVE